MSSEFTLTLPADPRFRELANDVVGRYVELAGVPEGERGAVTTAVARALDGLEPDTSGQLDLICTSQPAGFDITVRCGSRSAVVRHPQPATSR